MTQRSAFTYRDTLRRIRAAGGMTKTHREDLGLVTYHLMSGEAVWLEAAEALIRLGLVAPERDGLFGDDSQVYRVPDPRQASQERLDPPRWLAHQAAYKAAAAKCIQGAPECDNLCPFCRDMVDAAIEAFTGSRRT